MKKSQKAVAESLGISKLPTVIVFPTAAASDDADGPAEGDKVVYDGVLKNAPISEFFDKYALEKKVKAKKGKSSSSSGDADKKEKAKECMYIKTRLLLNWQLTHRFP